jgi:hypothetical protein
MGDMSASPKAEASPQAAYSMAADSPRSEEPIMFTMKQVCAFGMRVLFQSSLSHSLFSLLPPMSHHYHQTPTPPPRPHHITGQVDCAIGPR